MFSQEPHFSCQLKKFAQSFMFPDFCTSEINFWQQTLGPEETRKPTPLREYPPPLSEGNEKKK
jgi:hypothetical protein